MRNCYWILAAFGFVVLTVAAIWFGALNQDEGWYLYAANMVHGGAMPYRDFFYTQGPEMPAFYKSFTWIWGNWGLLGARIFTLMLGFVGICVATGLARHLTPEGRKGEAAFITFMLLGCNLYHLYYVAIPKTYALASMFVMIGFFLLLAGGKRPVFQLGAGIALAYAAGTRISLGALLCVVGLWLLCTRQWKSLLWFCIGGFGGIAITYGPYLIDHGARAGLVVAQQYHAARGGFDPVFTVGSVSRLVRWYLPVFIVLGLGGFRDARVLLFGFLAVFAVQMLAPFPYEDYQVPIMALLAVFAAVNIAGAETGKAERNRLLVLGLSFACAFGSPLLEKWMTNGQDRFWVIRKDKCELAQLREVAREIEALDPGGDMLLTQDTYLAIETGRKVPKGLEMGPFSMLTDGEWRELLESAPCPIAALSGYSFAIDPPECGEVPIERQMEYWGILKRRYELVMKEDAFGQNATTLLLLQRKP